MLEKFINNDIVNIYRYGSIVYGTNSYNSDEDFIFITKNNEDNGKEIRNGINNIHFYSIEHFQEKIDRHEPSVLECLFLDKKFILKNDYKFNFKLHLELLRNCFSQKASNSWVKAKKKIELENEYYIGIKSIFHSIRIIDFGIQIAKYNKIIDFSSMNYLWKELPKEKTEYIILKEKYQELYNKKSSEFRILAPKKKEIKR